MDPRKTGVLFTNILQADTYLTNLVAHNGSGVAIGDVNGDGWQEIYFASLMGPNRFYINQGNWHFIEVDPGEAACPDQLSTGVAFADVDGDGDLDLLVNGIIAGTRLFLNDGKGHWSEAKDSGLSRTASATSLALADIDGDGDLDLYCTHYIDVMHLSDPTTRFSLARRGDKWEVIKVNGESAQSPRWKNRFEALPDGKVRELPEVDGLYINDGHGHFAPIQNNPNVFFNEKGVAIPPFRDWGLAVMFRDINGDSAPDMYIANDNASPDRLWINKGNGTFQLINPMMLRHTSRSSMGVDFADVNRDGLDDFIVLDMLARNHGQRMIQLIKDLPDPQLRERIEEQPRYNRNALFIAQPDGSFIECSLWAGVAASDWSFCPIFLDVDLDGYEDLLISNGFSVDVMDQDGHDRLRMRQRQMTPSQLKRSQGMHPTWPTVNAAFRNRGDGSFEPAEREWGFTQPTISHGMALGDLDNDGDMDLVINNLNEAASLYCNNASAGRIAVRLKGLPPNTYGIGARIKLVGSLVTQSEEMICGGRYCSGDQAMRVFAANNTSGKPMRLEVKWRNGDTSSIDVISNGIYEVDQGRTARRTRSEPALVRETIFSDASAMLNHLHIEDAFDDWSIQPLLPRRMSRLGPGICWHDLNGDGWEDLAIASGRGGSLSIYTNDLGKRFLAVGGIPQTTVDQGSIIECPDGKGGKRLLMTASGYGGSKDSIIMSQSLTDPSNPDYLPIGKICPGPMALSDIDGDGDLDLFIGGRFLPGKYPEPVSSWIWMNEAGKLNMSAKLSKPFDGIGLVSGAVFCDIDGDGDGDLALATEWGPIRIFLNVGGHFEEHTSEWVLPSVYGWWTSITAGDFNNDGKPDLVAGNWGRNSFYELYRPGPLRIYYLPGIGGEHYDIYEAWQNAGKWLPIRDRLWLQKAIPDLSQRFPTHGAYASATIQDILGPRYSEARMVEAAQFESSIFLNQGSHFEKTSLPTIAQLSPVFSINVGDVDGDGLEDVFLSQNYFGAASDISRDDGGHGLWLHGNGDGTFNVMDSSVTGITILGEQRGAALADFNHDGRVDLVVSQNSATTKLFINQKARQGLRVKLSGPVYNPDGVGSAIRVMYPDGKKGPCRYVQAGSGYWSQDATTQVLGLSATPSSLWIRWPGGKEQSIPVKSGEWNYCVKHEK